jgi:hypothetical protein
MNHRVAMQIGQDMTEFEWEKVSQNVSRLGDNDYRYQLFNALSTRIGTIEDRMGLGFFSDVYRCVALCAFPAMAVLSRVILGCWAVHGQAAENQPFVLCELHLCVMPTRRL